MDIDDEIELIFNDLRITNDDIRQYTITNNYALFKQETASTCMGIEAIIFYEGKNPGDIQDCKMEETEGDEAE